MKHPRPLVVASLAVAALAVALLVVTVLRNGPRREGATGTPLIARPSLSPSEIYFGDLVHARIDVSIDPKRIDPDTMELARAFAPYRSVGPIRRVRSDTGRLSIISFQVTLRCLELRCLPNSGDTVIRPQPARIVFSSPSGRHELELGWPDLEVTPRILNSAFSSSIERVSSWRAQDRVPPAVSYRFSPTALETLLGILGGLLLLAGAALFTYHLVGTPEVVERWRLARLPPLERALRLLESSSIRSGSPARRRALDLLAVELARTGEPAKAGEARSLAWTDAPPTLGESRRIASEARELFEHKNGSDGDGSD